MEAPDTLGLVQQIQSLSKSIDELKLTIQAMEKKYISRLEFYLAGAIIIMVVGMAGLIIWAFSLLSQLSQIAR